MSHPNLDESAALLSDPGTDAATLALIAQHHESLRARVSAHPNVYPDLVAWIASLPAAAPAAAAVTPPTASWLATQWTAHRTRSIIAIAAVGALVLGGGGTALALSIPSGPIEQPAAQQSKPTPTPTKTTPPPVVKPVGSMTFAINQTGGLIRDWDSYSIGPNSFILAPGDSTQTDTQLTFTTVAVSEDSPLVSTAAFATTADPDYTIGSAVYAAQSSATEPAGFLVAMTVTVPVSGATPASTSLQVLPYGAGKTSPTTVNTLADWAGGNLESAFLVGSSAVITTSSVDEYTVGVDTETGEKLWELAGFEPYTATDRLVIGATGRTWNSMTGGESGQLVAIDAKSGAVAWTYSAGTYNDFEKDLGGGYAVISVRTGSGYAGDGSRIIKLSDGSDMVARSGNFFNSSTSVGYTVTCTYDPTIDSFVMVSDTDSSDGYAYALEVITPATGETTFSVAGDAYSGIGSPRVLGAGDGRVWVRPQSTGLTDIFSSSTGIQDPLSPALVANEDNAVWAPIATKGSVSLLEGINGYLRVVVHQNQPLTMALIQAASN